MLFPSFSNAFSVLWDSQNISQSLHIWNWNPDSAPWNLPSFCILQVVQPKEPSFSWFHTYFFWMSEYLLKIWQFSIFVFCLFLRPLVLFISRRVRDLVFAVVYLFLAILLLYDCIFITIVSMALPLPDMPYVPTFAA